MNDDKAFYEQIKQDKRLLIQSCFSIVEGDSQKVVPFLFRSEQDEYWKNRTLCDEILKPRKRGFSALIGAEFLSACILEKHCHALVVAHRDEDTEILFNRIRWMKDNLPFNVPVSQEGAGHLFFPQTESDFRVITARGKDPGRGRDITHLHLSERAFYPDEGFLAAVEGACTKNARRVIETTANGAGTPFHKHWKQTRAGKTAYRGHFFPWWKAPEYELDPGDKPLVLDDIERKLVEAYALSDRKLAWRRQKIREMSNPDLFDQEYPHSDEAAFLVSGRMVFDWVAIERMARGAQPSKWRGRLKNMGQKIVIDPSESGQLTIWSMPREDRRYVISADVAEGISDGAYSVADVLDASTWEQVAQWRGHCTPPEFADVLGDLGAFYNWGMVAPEVNNHGLTVCSRLADNGYSNLYVSEQKENGGVKYGWETTSKTKIMMINHLAHALKNMDAKINSEATLDELKSFVYLRPQDQSRGVSDHDRMGPQVGAFADCVMSLAIGISVLNDMKETPQSTRQRFREALGLRVKMPNIHEAGPGYGVRRI